MMSVQWIDAQMPDRQQKPYWTRISSKYLAVIAAIAFLVLVIIANAHLLKVAFESQPDCVVSAGSSSGDASRYKAAKPAC